MGYYSRSNWDASVPYRKSRAKPKPEPVRVLSDVELAEIEQRLRSRDERFKCYAGVSFGGARLVSVVGI